MTMIAIRVDNGLKAKIAQAAAQDGRSVSNWTRRILDRALAEQAEASR